MDTNETNETASKGMTKTRCLRLYLVRHGQSQANEHGIYAGQLDSKLNQRGIIDARALGERSEFLLPLLLSKSQKHDSYLFFDRVYSSDLSRARDTCELILKGMQTQIPNDRNLVGRDNDNSINNTCGKSINFDKRLRERSYGTLQGMPWNLDRLETDKIWRDTHCDDKQPPLFESDDEIWRRIEKFLSELVTDKELFATSLQSNVTNKNENANINTNKNTTMDTTTIKDDDDTITITKHVLITSHAGVVREILTRLIGIDKLKEMGAKFDLKRNNRLITANTSLTILDLLLQHDEQNATEKKMEKRFIDDHNGMDNINNDNDDIDDLRNVNVKLIVLANTDHLNGEVQICNE